jgi:hypothetical protein
MQPAPSATSLRVWAEMKNCPLCGGDNQCRVAEGHLYKGPCWCHEIVVSEHVLRRLAQDLLEQTCLCPTCLETVARLTREYADPERAVAEIHKTVESRASAQEDYPGQTTSSGQRELSIDSAAVTSTLPLVL